MSAQPDIVIKTGIIHDIVGSREAAYSDAIRSLAKYKFWMFGYHAASWVKYNRLLKGTPYHNGNPFKIFVHLAMIERGELDNARPHEIQQGKNLSAQWDKRNIAQVIECTGSAGGAEI